MSWISIIYRKTCHKVFKALGTWVPPSAEQINFMVFFLHLHKLKIWESVLCLFELLELNFFNLFWAWVCTVSIFKSLQIPSSMPVGCTGLFLCLCPINFWCKRINFCSHCSSPVFSTWTLPLFACFRPRVPMLHVIAGWNANFWDFTFMFTPTSSSAGVSCWNWCLKRQSFRDLSWLFGENCFD